MLHLRKAFSDNLFNPNYCRNLFCLYLRTKSGDGSGGFCWKTNGQEEEEEEGQIRLFKSRGQHLLTNPRVLDAIIRASGVKPDDTVLEIGPGTGNLTLKLLEAANKVVAVEIDSRMVEVLRKRVAGRGFEGRLDIINGDALRTEFPKFNLVVANIPYGISSPLLAKLVYGATKNPFRSATLLLQKEYARRLLAKPGDSEFNRLAVNVNLVATVEFVMDVSKRDFVPCPRVDSSVVKIYPKSEILNVDLDEWWAFTRTCFCKKNKTLGATFKQKRKLMELMKLSKFGLLSKDGNTECGECDSNGDGDEEGFGSCLGSDNGVGILRRKIVSVLESGEFLDKRPSKLSNDDLLCLLSLFNEAGISFSDQEKPKGGVCAAACEDLM
ncbi:Ribosomal RNA adenine dimethylase family protein [Striga hermonthica]|uniref:rRNA adenine N(6)-methyltransferase n=1 Tax=Striga hermonthica TaxID=68872 RepID=A0A9N7NNK0_STRHE|nr:Ribosomal RNA adenine dimethylase family protein [Striga hermonthica]